MENKTVFKIDFLEEGNNFSKSELKKIIGGRDKKSCICNCFIQIRGRMVNDNPQSE